MDRIDGVEDTKGNCGDKGVLRITNLRLTWHATAIPRINLSVGLSINQLSINYQLITVSLL